VYAVDTPEDGIPLHQLGLIVGRKGGGKGFVLFSLLRQLRSEGLADRIWVLSPTCQSNRALYQSAGVQEEDLADDATNASLIKVLAMIDDEAAEYQEHNLKSNSIVRLATATVVSTVVASRTTLLLFKVPWTTMPCCSAC
jgi:hypothetical protein